MTETNLCCVSPHPCPKCDASIYGVPRCNECGWVDPGWEAYEKEMAEFWKKPHKMIYLPPGRKSK